MVDRAELAHVEALDRVRPRLQPEHVLGEETERARAIGLQPAGAPHVIGAKALGGLVGQAGQIALEGAEAVALASTRSTRVAASSAVQRSGWVVSAHARKAPVLSSAARASTSSGQEAT